MIKAVITMENGKSITLELYEEAAPITVENFKALPRRDIITG
jgi:cyclophilin family peptidyl-prolyl cis-trans isomerase